ncbi:MAG: FecR family protein [Chitinophagaceae bacterium]
MEQMFNSAEDLAMDDSFKEWWLHSNMESFHRWEEWGNVAERNRLLMEEAVRLLERVRIKEEAIPKEQAEAAWQNTWARIEAGNMSVVRGSFRKWWWAAAVVLLFLGGAIAYQLISANDMEWRTSYGEMASKVLPDGSEVLLNSNTSVCFNKQWKEGRDREVWIEGEAFFEVKKTPLKQRFVVHAGGFDVIVTGTAFNVLSRNGMAYVTLQEGSVTVRDKNGKEVKLLPGDKLALTSGNWNKKQVKPEEDIAWKEKKMVFDNSSLQEVAEKITAHYGIPVVIEDGATTADRRITGILSNDSLDVILRSLEISMNIRAVKKADTILLQPRE